MSVEGGGMVEKNKEKYFSSLERWLVIIGGSVFIGVIFSYAVNFYGNVSDDIDDWAKLGDYFGGMLNPVIGLLALIAIILTLSHSRRAFSETHNELISAREAQEDLIRLQQLEYKRNAMSDMYISTFSLLQKEYVVSQGRVSFDSLLKMKQYDCCTRSEWNIIKFDLMTYAGNLTCISNALQEYKNLKGSADNTYYYFKTQLGRDLTLCRGMFKGILGFKATTHISEIEKLFHELISTLELALDNIGESYD